MFQLRYARRELRRRIGRTITTALGLAVGIGLVVGIIGVSQGLSAAQGQVLAPLQAVGTDILVTRVVGDTNTNDTTGSTTSTTAADQSQRGGFFARGGPNSQLNQADANALLTENSSVLTDLSKLGNPGDKFTHDFFLSATELSFPQDSVAQISKIPNVTSAVGGLTQLAQHETGTVPKIVDTLQTGGQTITQNVKPPPLTDAQRQQIQACIQSKIAASGSTTTTTPDGSGGGRRGGFGGVDRSVIDACVPDAQQFQAQFTTPLQSIQQIVNPPSTDTTATSYTAAGIDPAHPDQGLVTKAQLTAGRWIGSNAPNEVLLSNTYATKNKLAIGATIPINSTNYNVVGLVNPSLSGDTADIYFPLTTLQNLSSKQDRVTQVLVKVTNSKDVDAVAATIRQQLPGAQVVTTKDLADQVTGSLADAKKLTDRLGGALGVVVLIAAFIIAMLLTLSSVNKRVREIGTLRAIGWSKWRVVKQILIETLGIGILGGIAGIAIGALVCFAVSEFAPTFTATATGVSGLSGSKYSGLFGQSTNAVTTTANIALHAPLHPATIGLALVFAVIGGLLAGGLGGWRAARLAPATALRNVG